MFNVLSIRPSKDLRTNYAQISILAKQNPHLAQASEDIIHGRVQNTDDALDDILEELDDLEL